MRRAPLLSLLLLLTACAPAVTIQISQHDFPSLTLPATSDLHVLLIGDQGKGTEVQRAVARGMAAVCAEQRCDLGVGLGDNFYPRQPSGPDDPVFRERFSDLYGPLGVPFLMVAGNHDESWLAGGDGANPAGLNSELAYARRNPQWVMPDRSYRASVGQLAQFFVVDTAPLAAYLPVNQPGFRPGGPFDAAQRAWLNRSLGASTARWNIVLGHHPLLNNGRHGDAGQYDGLPLSFQNGSAVRALYGLACGRADLIASAHDHTLQSYAPQPECPGTRLVVSGAAGENTGPGSARHPAEWQSLGEPGFFLLSLTAQTLTVRAYTVDAAGAPTLRHTGTSSKL